MTKISETLTVTVNQPYTTDINTISTKVNTCTDQIKFWRGMNRRNPSRKDEITDV